MEMLMYRILQCTIVGVMMGSLYALIAFGFNLIHGVVRIVNFAHGMFVLVGMYLSMIFFEEFGLDPYLALVLTLPVAFIIGVVLHRLFVHPILNAPRINQFILTLGLMIFMENCLLVIFGGRCRGLSLWYTSKSILFENISINYALLFAFICTLFSMVGIIYFLHHTRLGKAMRAVADEREAAALLGTNVWNVYTIAFGFAAVLAAIAGAAAASYWVVIPSDGRPIVIKAFTVAIFGGAGSIGGTILGGVILGLLENYAVLVVNPSLASAISLGIMIAVILVRPSGILGKA
jgi:branched-chain amino acid transport system permease protein